MLTRKGKITLGLLFVAIAVVSIIISSNDIGSRGSSGANTERQERILSNYEYRLATETSGAKSYIFEKKRKPPLSTTSDGFIADVEDVNALLRFLELPTVSEPVQERSLITGNHIHRGHYLWDDYKLGALQIFHTSYCSRGSTCVWKVLIAEN